MFSKHAIPPKVWRVSFRGIVFPAITKMQGQGGATCKTMHVRQPCPFILGNGMINHLSYMARQEVGTEFKQSGCSRLAAARAANRES